MSSDPFRDRLRRLRRDGECASSAPRVELDEDESAARRASVHERLARREPAAHDTLSTVDNGSGRRSLGPPARLEESWVSEGRLTVRSTRFDADHLHGSFRLREVHAIDAGDVALIGCDPALARIDLSRALYFDTETTGLSGGAGTYVFLVGLGAFDERGFALWQGFLAHPADERALLAEVARRIRASGAIVSFFGKSFDRHRLEDRMRVHGIAPPFGEVCHLDLFYPLQRLYRGALADNRLCTLEAALCGVAREHDLSGAFAPAAWFDFLAGRAHDLEGVIAHNRDDVLSLVTLLAHLGRSTSERAPCGAPLGGPEAARAHGIAKILARNASHADAAAWFERAHTRALAASAPPSTVRRLLLAEAECLAKSGASDRALDALVRLCAEPEDECTAWAWSRRAELCERAFGDMHAGLIACERALDAAERWHTGRELARLERSCGVRRLRLARRVRVSAAIPGARAGPSARARAGSSPPSSS